MKKTLYIAYGSNLNKQQMSYRCQGAVFVGKGKLVDYRLSFKGGPQSAVATVERADGCCVPVGVWKIGREDELSLDIYEGYPRLYQKEMLTVHLDSGRPLKAMIYTIDPNLRHGVPSRGYYKTLLEGYEDCGLDVKYLNEAVAYSAKMYAGEIELGGYQDCGFGYFDTKDSEYSALDDRILDERVPVDDGEVEPDWDSQDEGLFDNGLRFSGM